jgi:GGDEF domain-containing protein
VRALDTLSRGDEISSSFTEIINSNQIKRTAIDKLNVSPQMQIGLEVNSHTISGTNVLEIQVQGNDPNMVKEFADEVISETMSRVGEIYGVFELEPLDNFLQPTEPIRSNLEIIGIGFFIALFSSVGVVLLGEYAISSGVVFKYLDYEPILYTQSYFRYRLKQEISRSKHKNSVFSIALIKNFDRQSNQELSQISIDQFVPLLRQEDVIANTNGKTIGIIFPNMSGVEVIEKISGFIENFVSQNMEELNKPLEPDIVIKVGIVDYDGGDLGENELIELANQGIREDVGQENKNIYYFSNLDAVAINEDQENISLTVNDG